MLGSATWFKFIRLSNQEKFKSLVSSVDVGTDFLEDLVEDLVVDLVQDLVEELVVSNGDSTDTELLVSSFIFILNIGGDVPVSNK